MGYFGSVLPTFWRGISLPWQLTLLVSVPSARDEGQFSLSASLHWGKARGTVVAT